MDQLNLPYCVATLLLGYDGAKRFAATSELVARPACA